MIHKKSDKALLTLCFVYFFINFILNVSVVGPTDDAEYFLNKKKVVGFNAYGGKLFPLFNHYGDESTGAIIKNLSGIKLVLQPLPPTHIVQIGNLSVPIATWPHTSYLPNLLQVPFLYVSYSIYSLIVYNLSISIIFLLIYFSLSSKLNSNGGRVFSFLLFSTSTAFNFISCSIQAAAHYYYICSIFLLFSLYFALLYIERRKFKYILLSAIFISFTVLSHIKTGMISLIALTLSLIFTIRNFKIALLYFIFALLSLLPFFAFWFFFYKVHPPYFSLIHFPQTSYDFFNILKGFNFNRVVYGLHDLAGVFDFLGIGRNLWFEYSHNPSYIWLFPLITLPMFIFIRKWRSIALFSLIYISIESLSSNLFGFPRRFFALFPVILLIYGEIAFYIWRKKWLLSAILVLLFISLQIYRTHKIFNHIRSGNTVEIYHPHKYQKELAEYLQNKGIKKPVIISGFLNIELLSQGRTKPIDWSYAWHFSKDSKNILALILKMNRGRYIIIDWSQNLADIKNIALEHSIKIKEEKFFPEGKPVFILAFVEDTN